MALIAEKFAPLQDTQELAIKYLNLESTNLKNLKILKARQC